MLRWMESPVTHNQRQLVSSATPCLQLWQKVLTAGVHPFLHWARRWRWGLPELETIDARGRDWGNGDVRGERRTGAGIPEIWTPEGHRPPTAAVLPCALVTSSGSWRWWLTRGDWRQVVDSRSPGPGGWGGGLVAPRSGRGAVQSGLGL